MELEFKRLQRRRLFAGDGESSGPSSLPGSPGGSGSSSSTGAGHTTSASSSNKDQPLFTLKQVYSVCIGTVLNPDTILYQSVDVWKY